MIGQGRRENTEFDERVIALADMGKSQSEIANRLLIDRVWVHRIVKRLGIATRDARGDYSKGTHDQARADVMAARYASGETLQKIGDTYGLTRERVRQILRSHTDITAEEGGASIRNAKVRAERISKRDRAYMEKLGCGWEEYKSIRDLGRTLRAKGAGYHTTPLGAFISQRSNAHRRGIGWELLFWDWWGVWQASGRWSQRGRGQGYVMCRRNDSGPYAVNNVFIATAIENSSSGKHKKSSLPTGVRFNKGRFEAHRTINGRRRYLGRHATAAEAYAAYVAAAPGISRGEPLQLARPSA